MDDHIPGNFRKIADLDRPVIDHRLMQDGKGKPRHDDDAENTEGDERKQFGGYSNFFQHAPGLS